MAVARRIVLDLSTAVKHRGGVTQWSTAVKQRRGVPQWSRGEIARCRRNDLVPQWSREGMARNDLSTAAGIPQRSRREMASGRRIDLSTAVKHWRGIPHSSIHCNKNRFSTNTHLDDDYFRKTGYIDVVDLLSTPERDFLVRNDGQKVLVSSLKGKLVGLYLCENKPQPPSMQAIKKVYEEAKSRGHDFEIVQITFDFHGKHLGNNLIVRQFCDDITWLILPFMDPSFKKIERIFQCVDEEDGYWEGDSLVLIHPCQAGADDSSQVLFEFSGAQILKRWGIEGYPFTRRALYKAESELQKRQITLQFLFPPGESLLLRPRPNGDGFDRVDALSQLSGKKVLVLFAKHAFGRFGVNFVSMLKSKYHAQLEDNVAEESKFEVVYVSTGSSDGSSFDEFAKDMPWMVQPFPLRAYWDRLFEVFKPCPRGAAAAVAFNERGELIAKEDCLGEEEEGDNPQFPFIEDLEKRIRVEVEKMCNSRS